MAEGSSQAKKNIVKQAGCGMECIVVAGLAEIAAAMGCSRKTLYKWIRTRGFPAYKLDGVWRAMPAEMRAWFRRSRQEGGGAR